MTCDDNIYIMGNIQHATRKRETMQNLHRAIVSMPSDKDARPFGHVQHLTIDYGEYSWTVQVPQSEFSQAHLEMTRKAEHDGVER